MHKNSIYLKKNIVNVHKTGKRYKTIAKDYYVHQSSLDHIVQMDKMQPHSYFSQDLQERFLNKIFPRVMRRIYQKVKENSRVMAKNLKAITMMHTWYDTRKKIPAAWSSMPLGQCSMKKIFFDMKFFEENNTFHSNKKKPHPNCEAR